MIVNLSPENEAFVQAQISTGEFETRDEALNASVAVMRQRNELVIRVRESKRQLDVGEFVDYDEASLKARFDQLKLASMDESQRT